MRGALRDRTNSRASGWWPRWFRRTLPIVFITLLAAASVRAGTVSGFVRSAASGEALGYANVYLKGTSVGAITNAQGFYSIAGVAAGAYTILFSYLGYATESREITVSESDAKTLSVELRSSAITLEKIDVQAEGKGPAVTPSKLTLITRQLGQVPSVAEADLFRAVQALPGVSTLSDFSSGLYVRGGSPDQNLILLDDVDVYNPSHLFGFFSTFNVDAVKTVELQKSGYPARYGGRLSSLLDVHNREGNRKEFEGVGRASVIGSSLTLEGPWPKGSWMLSGRRTYLSAIAKAVDIDLPYRFYDLHARLNYDFSGADRSSLSFFKGNDRLAWKQNTLDIVLDWGNDTWSTQWTHVFNSRVFSHFLVGGSLFHSNAEIAFQDFEFRFKNKIQDLAAKGALSFKPSPSHIVDFGFEAKSLDFRWRRDVGEGDRLEFNYDGLYAAVYGQDSWTLEDRWRVQPGLRLDYYSKGSYTGLGPRVSVERTVYPLVTARATYGRYYQYLNLVSQAGATFADMWFPVDGTLKPGSADHYILGADFGPFEAFDFSIEGYYKDYRNLVEFSEEFTRSLVDQDARLGELFNSGTGKAYGADVYLKNRFAGFDGWIGYAWGKARRHVARYNRGEEYTPVYDRRHQITFMQVRPIGNGWTMDVSFRYGTGQPTTLAVGRYQVRDITGRTYDVPLLGHLNENRLPDFHRLDVGFSKLYKFRRWSLEPNIQIINVYNHKNVYVRSYDLEKNPAKFDDVTMLPFLPTIGVNIRF
jgi:outer membrane receptor protein involved in Fe transport